MATEIMRANDGLLFNEETVLAHQQIMAPSPRAPVSPRSRHGRGKHGGSIGRARAASTTNEREVMISKTLAWILKRGVGEKKEEDGIDVEFDEEGWADCEEVLQWPNLQALNPTLLELQSLISNNPRNRFQLKAKSEDENENVISSWLIRLTACATTPAAPIPGTILTSVTETLPELALYATSYSTYAHILASGSLNNMGGSNVTLSTSLPEDSDSYAEVLFYIDLHSILATGEMTMILSENETTITIAEGRGISKTFWKKVVGRKGDLGTLWEDGEVIRDVPIGVRGKKAGGGKDFKGRNGKAKGGKRSSWKVSGDEGSE